MAVHTKDGEYSDNSKVLIIILIHKEIEHNFWNNFQNKLFPADE